MKALRFLPILLLPLLLIACTTSRPLKEESSIPDRNLIGIKKLWVVINPFDFADPTAPDIESAGITKSMIKTAIESKLLEVGIKVIPTARRDLSFLIYVVEKPNHQSVKYNISLTLFRTGRYTLWERGIIDVVQEEDFKEMAMENLNNLLNQFLDYYLKAYPR